MAKMTETRHSSLPYLYAEALGSIIHALIHESLTLSALARVSHGQGENRLRRRR